MAHDVASREPQEEQNDKKMTETAAATATARAPRLVGLRVGGRGRRSLGSSLVAGWELIRGHRFLLGIHLVVGVEERALERLSRRHWDKRVKVKVKRAESDEV